MFQENLISNCQNKNEYRTGYSRKGEHSKQQPKTEETRQIHYVISSIQSLSRVLFRALMHTGNSRLNFHTLLKINLSGKNFSRRILALLKAHLIFCKIIYVMKWFKFWPKQRLENLTYTVSFQIHLLKIIILICKIQRYFKTK